MPSQALSQNQPSQQTQWISLWQSSSYKPRPTRTWPQLKGCSESTPKLKWWSKKNKSSRMPHKREYNIEKSHHLPHFKSKIQTMQHRQTGHCCKSHTTNTRHHNWPTPVNSKEHKCSHRISCSDAWKSSASKPCSHQDRQLQDSTLYSSYATLPNQS